MIKYAAEPVTGRRAEPVVRVVVVRGVPGLRRGLCTVCRTLPFEVVRRVCCAAWFWQYASQLRPLLSGQQSIVVLARAVIRSSRSTRSCFLRVIAARWASVSGAA